LLGHSVFADDIAEDGRGHLVVVARGDKAVLRGLDFDVEEHVLLVGASLQELVEGGHALAITYVEASLELFFRPVEDVVVREPILAELPIVATVHHHRFIVLAEPDLRMKKEKVSWKVA